MEVIILAGGLGTRLGGLTKSLPKPMLPINKKPFLEHLLNYLSKFNCTHIILSISYKKESIQNYFGDTFKGISISYSIESQPLGTGGAIKQALKLCTSKKVMVLNGDTFFNINLEHFFNTFSTYPLSLSSTKVHNFDRYGTLTIKNNQVVHFEEKKYRESGFINAGIYIVSIDTFKNISQTTFSFESFLAQQGNIPVYISDGYFIDIGIPEDYTKAENDFKDMF